ncbi:Pyridoxine 5'-phosphate synthase [Methyloligella halotolerans]|uniref:Pyridoxine 5'-phosphate synthase n=1 Tax=Methyloligella halotolerans TaxID=1177755 RepID=A0A1E2S272_9HYPH|nr:pyridoxine 5'-phosphate synthase [Methyloligella halotolerans]ODA68596.1 Pyridoxine 5'-phosphate synthase [Methyloligella halotolerans]
MTSEPPPIRLGINVDHVATLRNARGGTHPDVVRAAQTAIDSGADNITAHLREDRRHIRDEDIARLVELSKPLNMEMAVTPEMLQIALRTRPHANCLVPERREELTTEGGLDVASQVETLKPFVAKLRDAGIRVSLFIDPDLAQIEAAATVEPNAVELHTGTYCEAGLAKNQAKFEKELARLQKAAQAASDAGLEVHAGHGLTYGTVGPVAAIPQIVELNIGHFLVGEALFVGLGESVRHMRRQMNRARRAVEATGRVSADETL